ncbi:HAD hydrolase-like protein [Candidatus Gracilibacteria bacterium]|nr:HAD hydrolase-like protein [Candidatus Gracilibacteria bacterium]
MVRNTIFDLDDTLVCGSEAVKQAAFFECIRRFKDPSLIKWMGDEEKQQSLYNSGSNTRKRLDTFPEGTTKDDFIEFYNENKDRIFVELLPKSPVSVFGDAGGNIGGTKSGIFTDSSRIQLDAVLGRFPELGQLFAPENIITQNDISKRKPHPEGIKKLLSQWGVPPEEVQYIDDGWSGIEAAVKAKIGQIFLLERVGTERKPNNLEQATLLRTGQIMKARTLDILNQERTPFVMILRGRQYAGKGFVGNRLGIPFAMVNKDYVAEIHGMQRRKETEYTPEVREKLYGLFTQRALASMARYGHLCLDAPFTYQRDVDAMIVALRETHPHLRVLVTTVQASEEERKARMTLGRQEEFPGVVSVGMQHIVPPHDAFESQFDDTIQTPDTGVDSIIIENGEGSGNFDKPIRQAMEKLGI